ncbi:MAG: Histidine kinase [Microgenomates group bacterium GW2011_GWA2_47_8]|nr:MAG: Histidine kinase [Microgenomates group bacterium GW2011_GWA2_47_8]
MFKQARIKLTAWYLVILMLVTIFFSFAIHSMLIRQVRDFVTEQRFRIERRFGPIQPPGSFDSEFVEEANRRITLTLILINSGILIVAGGLGYFLAGKTLKPIQIMVEDQNRFITNASHELRTPLTSLKLAIEVALRNKDLTLKESKKIISENLQDVNHLQDLSVRLLRLTTGKNSGQKILTEKISLKKVIEESVKKISGLAKSKNILIKNLVNTDRIISGNQTDLVELFSILLDNAIKYSQEKTKVTLSLKEDNQSADISVTDQGIGIEENDLPRIFDRFFRSNLARSKTKVSGFGLGLSIAKKIVKDHHGNISVQSKSGKGSIFTIHLPS